MEMYNRQEPYFALCGLNCCLCPRFHTDGTSKCPGCGGADFSLQHPTCAVVTCTKKHGNVEYCFECNEYPCERYKKIGKEDSFITYKNVISNISLAQKDLKSYLKTLNKKYECLKILLEKYNDGKSKSLYCTAVELFPIEEMERIVKYMINKIQPEKIGEKEKAKKVVGKVKEKAKELNIELALRK